MASTTIDPLGRRIRLRINALDHTKTSLKDLGMLFPSLRSLLRLSSYREGPQDCAYLNRAGAEMGG